MKYQGENTDVSHKKWLLTQRRKAKAESILFNEVVQRYYSDEKVIRWQALLTKLI